MVIEWPVLQPATGESKQETLGDNPMTKRLHGTVHGRTIELDEDPGVADGQKVELQIEVEPKEGKWGDGILRSDSKEV